MAKKVPDAPAAPDPAATAAGQTNANVQTAVANTIMGNANETSPLGTVRYNQIGTQQIRDAQGNMIDVPQYERVTELSEAEKIKQDQQNRLGTSMNDLALGQIDRLSSTLNRPFDTSGLPVAGRIGAAPQLTANYSDGGPVQRNVGLDTNAPTTFGQTAGKVNYGIDPTSGQIQYKVGADDFSKDRDKVEEALFSRLEPQLNRDRAALDSRLRNQGLVPGTEAYNRAMDGANRSATDARMQAVAAGGAEQSRLFGMDVTKATFNNNAQAQEFGQNAQRTSTNNSAQQQDYDQQSGRGLYALAATDQNNSARLNEGNFYNTAQAQQNGQNRDAVMFDNETRQRDFGNRAELASFDNTNRERALQERLTERNQPLNEVGALMSGGQVNMPTFTQYRPGTVGETPYASSVYSSANMTQDAWRTQQQMEAQNRAGLYALAGSVVGAGGRILSGGARA